MWKIADIPGSDPYPGEEPERSALDLATKDDKGTKDWNPTENYNFILVGGQFHVGTNGENFDQLVEKAGADSDQKGPMALGYMKIDMGKINFYVQTNIHGAGIISILEDFANKHGLQVGSISDMQGNPIGRSKEVESFYFQSSDQLLFSRNKSKLSKIDGAVHIRENRAVVYPSNLDKLSEIHEPLQEWAKDYGFILYGYEGLTDNVIKRVEDEEMGAKTYSPEFYDEEGQFSTTPMENDTKPEGPQQCSSCGKWFKTFDQLKTHRRYEEETPWEDGGRDDAGADVFYRKFPDFSTDGPIPTWRYHDYFFPFQAARFPKPKAPIPFIYDIAEDKLTVGSPTDTVDALAGSHFTPGGLVRGAYEPSGKIVLDSVSDYSFSIRHLLDLFAYSPSTRYFPIKSVWITDQTGKENLISKV